MILALIVFAVSYFFIATEKVDKTLVAILGGAAMILVGGIPYEEALLKVDLNVVFLLSGMMIIINVLSHTGVFEWVAITIAKTARGRGTLLLPLLLLATAVISAFLDNVTTLILIVPATILICQLLELPAPLFLTLEAIFSNIGGTATLIGDPPNILIGSKSNASPLLGDHGTLNFNAFISHLSPVIVVVLVVALLATMAIYRKRLFVSKAARRRLDMAQPELAILDPKRLKRSLWVLALVIFGFFIGHQFHIEPGLVALAGAFLMMLVCGLEPLPLLERVEWNTIFFFIGLFIMIGGLEYQGVFDWLGHKLVEVTRGNLLATALLVLWVAGVASAIVDNIPLVIAMIPLLHSVVIGFARTLGIEGTPETLTPEQIALVRDHIHMPLFWCMALGACLGGNGSLIGASANVVAVQLARRNGYKLSFMQFTRIGFPIMILSLCICSVYVYLRYFSTPIPGLE
jgi:Na+/H+ antiporter NhaD and related arsenite permeases